MPQRDDHVLTIGILSRNRWFGTNLAAAPTTNLESAALPSAAKGVGKYLSNPSAAQAPISASIKRKEPSSTPSTSDLFAELGGGGSEGGGAQKKKKRAGGFGDFSAW